ncbi:MAG: zinc ABC transporter substrate-binding protein [Pseudomonadota bacterium]
MTRLSFLPAFCILLSSQVNADVPTVATDIAPVHGLVSRVMDGVGEPELLIPPTQSPHDFALRPSQATSLANADLMIWISPELTPPLARSVESIGEDVDKLTLLEVPGIELLDFREDFEGGHDDHEEHGDHDDHDEHEEHADGDKHDDHDDHEEHADGDKHDDHDDHEEHADGDKHDDHDDHEEHADGDKHDDHGHAHGDDDPHAWMEPGIAVVWVDAIAEALSELDPENAALYSANAQAAQAEITEAAQGSADGEAARVVVFHDAYQYLEGWAGLTVVGAFLDAEAADPSAARLVELQELFEDGDISCTIRAPQFPDDLMRNLIGTTDIPSVIVDPLGADIPLGPQFYVAHMNAIRSSLGPCYAAN